MAKSIDKWQFGDFQTPDTLAREVTQVLKENHKILPKVIIEPTCGKGTFIRAALDKFPESQIIGMDINKKYVEETRLSISNYQNSNNVSLYESDFFDADWESLVSIFSRDVLIIGNPPWVTSSELSVLNSQNLPSKSNFHNRRGIEAITGSGNFDISEWMLLKYVEWLSEREGMIAVLCKYSVARKVMLQARKKLGSRFSTYIYLIDAKLNFGASVEACLFVLSTDNTDSSDCKVYRDLQSREVIHIIGERDGWLLRDTANYQKWRHLSSSPSWLGDGKSVRAKSSRSSHLLTKMGITISGQDLKYVWRSGIKHDCSKVMELEQIQDALFLNGMGEKYCLEKDYLYPLLKSSDIGNGRTEDCRKMVLITQKSVGDDTSIIQTVAPKTWQYLLEHDNYLKSRRSAIYKNRPLYSIFGIGSYSFRNWKIAISGLYKQLKFCLVKPLNGKPVMFDDTVNFLSFETEEEARFIFELITSTPAIEFLDSMIFWDEKRPITIDTLKRLSLESVARELGVLENYFQWAETTQISPDGLKIF